MTANKMCPYLWTLVMIFAFPEVLFCNIWAKCSTMWTRNFFVFLLCSIDFQCYTISCPMLRPLSCLTKFCDHNFSLVCRFNLQFSRTVAHFTIFSSPFSSCSILFCIQLCKTHTTRLHMDVFTPIWTLNGDYCSRK